MVFRIHSKTGVRTWYWLVAGSEERILLLGYTEESEKQSIISNVNKLIEARRWDLR